jgi:sugar phosphate isomerase/epimerase
MPKYATDLCNLWRNRVVNLKLATADYSFPLLAWEQTLRLAHDIGIEGIDISLFAGRSHLKPEEVLSHPSQAASRVSDALKAQDLEIADVFGQPGKTFQENAPNDPDPGVRQKAADYFYRILEFTARCNGKHLTILPGIHFRRESYEDSLKRCAGELAWRCEAAEKIGVCFAVEAHLGSIVPTPEQAKRLLGLAPKLTLALDYTHFTCQGIPDEEIEPLLSRASHFHARCACKGRLQAPLKENTIDFHRVLRVMEKERYSGFIAIEYVWIDSEHCNEVDNLSETILLRDLLRSAMLGNSQNG